MTNFERANKVVAVAEGGANFLVVDGEVKMKSYAKYDKGGPTIYGITESTLESAFQQGLVDHDDITQLTKDEADHIYKVKYWDASKANEMKWGLCLVHFDCAVNCGVKTAGKILQRACNRAVNPKLEVDGAIGPKTLEVVNNLEPGMLSSLYLAERKEYYEDIVARNKSQGIFLKGWLGRLDRIAREVN